MKEGDIVVCLKDMHNDKITPHSPKKGDKDIIRKVVDEDTILLHNFDYKERYVGFHTPGNWEVLKSIEKVNIKIKIPKT